MQSNSSLCGDPPRSKELTQPIGIMFSKYINKPTRSSPKMTPKPVFKYVGIMLSKAINKPKRSFPERIPKNVTTQTRSLFRDSNGDKHNIGNEPLSS
jgi:hypothetical protein